MKNTEQYISSRTRRNVARFHQELLSEDLQKRYDEVNQPPPLAESIIQSVFTPPPPLQPHLSEDSLLLPRQLSGDRGGVSGKGKKKAGMFGFFKKIFRRKKTKSLQVNLNDFSSVSSKESLEKTLLARRSSFPTSLGPPSEKKADGEQSVNSNEVSGGSSASEVFTRIKSTASVFSNVSNESDKTSLSDHSEHIDEFPDEQYSELPSTVSHLRMTFSRDEDDIQKRASKGEFAIRIPKLRPDLRTAGMVKLSADSEESQADHSPKIYNQSSTLTTNPTLSSSAEEVNINRAHSSALTTTETSPLNLRRTSSSLSPGGTTKTAPTVTIAADVVDNSMQKDYTNGGSTFSLTSKLKSEKNLKRAQLSTRMSRSFMVRPGSQISALSPLNRVPSSLEPSLSPTLWRPTSQPVLSQQPHVQIVPRYNSTSAIPTAKPTEEFFAGLPYQPAFQSFYAKSFYIPKSPTANTAMALHEFNFPPPLSIPTYSEYGFPVVESNLPTNTTSKTTNATMTPAMHSFYVPSSPYPRAPPTALRRKNSNLRYETVDATEQSHYGEIQNFNSLSQFFNSEPFISAPPHPPTQHHTVHSHPPSHPPPPIHQIYQHSSHSYTSSSASYDPSVTLTANYYDYSDLSEDHSYSNEPTYIELQRKRERKYEAAKKKRDIEKLNEVALREAIQLSLEEQKSQSSNRTKKYEEIERANEEGLRLALLLSMQEVKNRSQQSMETLTNSSSSNPNTNRNSLTKNNSGLNSSNGSKPQSRPLSRASNFPTEEYPYALKQQHYPSSASHSHSPSPPPPSVSGSMHYSGSLQHQMKKISSGSLSGGVQSRESRGSSSANYSPVPGMSSSNASETQPQRRTRRIQRIVLDSNTGGKITGLNL